MIRRALRILARLTAGLIVVAVLTVPVVLMARVAGNPFGGDLLRRVHDRSVDDATILRLLSIGFYVLWAWFALPAIRQARLCLGARHSRPSAQASPRSVPVVVDRGPQGWLTRLVRYALTSSTIAAITTTTTLAVFPSSALSSMHGSTQATARPAATVVVNDARHSIQSENSERPDPVSEIVARRRDTPYSIAARLFPDRLDGARDEILALNVGRPTPGGGMYQGGAFPEGMTVLTPRGQSASDQASPATSGDAGWLPGETVVVQSGDNVWDLSAERLDRADGETLTPTNAEIADHMHLVIDTNTFPSGNPSLIFPGDTIDFPAIGSPPLAQPTEPPPLPPPPAADLPAPPATEAHPPPSAPPDVLPPTEAPTIAVETGTTVPARHPADTKPGAQQAAPALTDNDASPDRSLVTLAGVTGTVALASGLATALVRQRRRRRALGTGRPSRLSTRQAEVETAIVAASDVPFTRWAGEELAALARQLTPTAIKGAPIAVELEPGVGIEILWDQPCQTAPIPWEATDGGWSWRVHYDPDEPTPLAEWPSPIPALATVGTRGHRQLLVDLEAVGTLAVSGPPADVEAWIRAVVLELGAGDDLADASVLTVGSGVDGVEHLERVADVHPDEAIGLLTARARDITDLLDGNESLFHRRLGENPVLGLSTDVVVCGDVELETQTQIAACVVPRHGAAVILTADVKHAGARLVLDGYGSAVLHDVGPDPILITPVGVPRETAAEIAVLLDHEHDASADEPFSDEVVTELVPDSEQRPTDEALASASEPGAAFVQNNLLDSACSDNGDDEWCRPEPALLVRVLGRPAVPDRPEIQGLKLRLLVYLACQNGRTVSRSRILDAVWGGEARERKTFSNKLSDLRNTLGTSPTGSPLLSTATDAGVRLDPSVRTDLSVFIALAARARDAASNEAIELLSDALTLVHGEPFDDGGYEWADATQDNVQTHDHILNAARDLCRLACEADDLTIARFALVQGLKAVPGHEDLYRLRMQLEHRAANTAAIHATFNELTHQLNVLECEPSTETVNLYRQLVGRRS
jgi:DNA-binding winged helix-turn-helix (wHTH) protein